MVARILVVDNDKQHVRLVRFYLEHAGMMTFPAYNGEEALHFLRAERPDLLILDLILPQRNGWEIIQLVRKDIRLSGIPILILTAQAEDACIGYPRHPRDKKRSRAVIEALKCDGKTNVSWLK